MIVDGKQIAGEVLQELEQERRDFGVLSLGIVMSAGDKATESFVKIKTRVAQRLGIDVHRFTPGEMPQALLCDGVLVQLPIENADVLIAAVPPEKDVDALGPYPVVRSPVAEAVAEILARSGVDTKNKKAVVVGAGRLVGAPAAKLLRELGADVTVVTHSQGSLGLLKTADIVVCGAGEPGFIKPEMLKQGVVLIDAGTSEIGGKLAGDADPACAAVCSVFTPVPGGVGPIAVAMIFKNLFTLAKKNSGH